jgi:hypothetical protein
VNIISKKLLTKTSIKIDENKAKLEEAIQSSKKTMQNIDNQLNLKMSEKVLEIRNIETEIENSTIVFQIIQKNKNKVQKNKESLKFLLFYSWR